MGNYRFKLSDMIPNAWFYKLKDIGKGRTNINATNNKKPTTSSKKNQTSSSSSTATTTATNTTQSPKPKQPHQNQNQCTPRKSYYFTRELIHINNNNNNNNSPPRKSSPKQQKRVSRRRKGRTTTVTPPRVSISSPKLATTTSSSAVSAGCSCRTTLESVWTKSADSPPESSSSSSSSPPFDDDSGDFPQHKFRTDSVLPTESSSSMFDEMLSLSTNTNTNTNTNADIVIGVDKNSLARKDDKLDDGYDDSFSDLYLPPIITKPNKVTGEEPKKTKGSLKKVKLVNVKEQNHQQQRSHHNTNSCARGFSVNSPGLKLRINSPRLGRKALQPHGGRRSVSSASSGRSLSGSFAVVKSSFDPQKDFRESMVEMIVENNIRASKDLEDLLACYLSLNSDQYHDVIINVFKQIWFDLTLPTR